MPGDSEKLSLEVRGGKHFKDGILKQCRIFRQVETGRCTLGLKTLRLLLSVAQVKWVKGLDVSPGMNEIRTRNGDGEDRLLLEGPEL